MNGRAKTLNDQAVQTHSKSYYSNADVQLRRARPFRVISMHFDSTGRNVPAGDDPDAPVGSSRFLTYFFTPDAQGQGIPLHAHEFYEFVLIHKASDNVHLTAQGELQLTRGDVLIVAPGAKHGYQPMQGLYKTEMLVQPQWLSYELKALWNEEGMVGRLLATSLFELPFDEGLWTLHLHEAETEECEHELDSMVKESALRKPSLAYLSGCFLKVLAIMNRRYLLENENLETILPQEVWKATSILERLIEAESALDRDLLIKGTSLSYRSLSRLFRIATGSSITEYYQKRRIQHAQRLLTEDNTSITEIAHKLNFSDAAHFIRIFKRLTGETPSDFRKTHMLSSD